jgi:CRISPR-associated protein Csd1
MMLQSLFHYAQTRGLLDDPNSEIKGVRFQIRIKSTGRVVGVSDLADDKGKPKLIAVPRWRARTGSDPAPGFLVDNCKFVLGIPGVAKPSKLKGTELAAETRKLKAKALSRFESFVEYQQALIGKSQDAGLKAVLAFLADIEIQRERVFELMPQEEWNPNDNIAFSLDSDEISVHERAEAKAVFAASRIETAVTDSELYRCLISGSIGAVAVTHPPIKGIPNGQTTGTALVTFNSSAFESQGREQGFNAPISRAAAEGYVTALNSMLTRDRVTKKYTSGIGIGEDTVLLVWTREPTTEVNAMLTVFDPPTKDDALEVIRAPFVGFRPSKFDATPFYATSLSANASRVVVRDWVEDSFGNVKNNVMNWFELLQLSEDDSEPIPLWKLMKAIDPPGKSAAPPPTFAAALARAVFFRGKLPLEMIRHALARIRVPTKEIEKKFEISLLKQRVALIKATLIRTCERRITVSLDPENKEVPYLLGRLFAILEKLQSDAIPGVGSGIRDRFFTAASTNPGVVMARLIQLSHHHVSKLGRKAIWLDRLRGEILGLAPAIKFPTVLSLEDQGLFAVGYFHQRNSLYQPRNAESQPQEHHPLESTHV